MIGLRNGYIDFVNKPYDELQPEINRLQRRYMAAQMEVMKDKRFYRTPAARCASPTVK